MTQRRPRCDLTGRGSGELVVLLAGTLLSGSGSARLGLFQNGDPPSSGEVAHGVMAPTRARLRKGRVTQQRQAASLFISGRHQLSLVRPYKKPRLGGGAS